MTSVLEQQQRLLADKLAVLHRLQEGLRWSLDRLPPIDASNAADPAVGERAAAIVDRFRKLQDQLASAMRHAPLLGSAITRLDDTFAKSCLLPH